MRKPFEELTYEDRKKLYIDAVAWNKPERVMFNAYMMAWVYHDAGYTIDVASRDYAICSKILYDFGKKYKVDTVADGGPGFRYTYRFTDHLGSTGGYAGDDKTKDGNVQAIFENFIGPEDYDAYKADPQKVTWEKVLFNMFPNAKNLTPKQIADATMEVSMYNQVVGKVYEDLRQKYGWLIRYGDAVGFNPFVTELFCQLRGIKGLSIDLRRQPEKVYELSDYFNDQRLNAALNRLESLPDGHGNGIKNFWDAITATLAHTVLNNKQIDRLCIKYWKPFFDAVEAKNKNVHFNVEGLLLPNAIGDFVADYKKGTLMIVLEQDDPYEVRKKLPNVAIKGGLSVDLLGHATPHECVEAAKRAIDELGRDGGLMLCPNKMVTYKYDMTSENLKAIADFTSEYYIN